MYASAPLKPLPEVDVGSDETPDVEAYALYAYLSSLLGEMVDALDS